MLKKIFSLIKVTILIICIVLISSSCSMQKPDKLNRYLDYITKSDTIHESQLEKYNSPYTSCYKNKDDTYTLYIFAAPVQFKQEDKYNAIDNSIIKTKREGYIYENKANSVKVYFPDEINQDFLIEKENESIEISLKEDLPRYSKAKKETFINMYGDKVDAVKYENENVVIHFYCTNLGLKMEIELSNENAPSEYRFSVKHQKPVSLQETRLFTKWSKDGETISVMYPSLITDANKHLVLSNDLAAIEEENSYEESALTDMQIKIPVDKMLENGGEFPLKTDPSFEFYDQKMPDSTAYSELEETTYLSNYFTLGHHSEFGESAHYLRMRLNYFFTTAPNNIKNASYNLKQLDTKEEKIQMMEVTDEWSSVWLRWQEKQPIGKIVSEATKINNYNNFDITDFIKESVVDFDWLKESYGVVLKTDADKESSFFASSDNTLYPPYIKITFNQLPLDFEVKENINDV